MFWTVNKYLRIRFRQNALVTRVEVPEILFVGNHAEVAHPPPDTCRVDSGRIGISNRSELDLRISCRIEENNRS
jgi:tRNA G37 N-methylase TrmD